MLPVQAENKRILVLYFGNYASKNFKENFFYWHTPADLLGLVVQPLKNVFPETRSINFFEDFGDSGQLATNRLVLQEVEEFKPHFVIWCTLHYEFYPATLRKIRDMGTKVVALSFDDIWRAETYVVNLLRDIDVLVFNDYTYIDFYKKLKNNTFFTFFYSVPRDSYCKNLELMPIYDVSFIGSRTDYRDIVFQFLKDNGVDVQLFGYGWPNGSLSNERCLEVFKESKINLSVNSFFKGYTYFNPRIFQIMLSNGFAITEKPPLIDRYFSEGQDIVTFDGKEDLLAKIKYYLANDSERIDIASTMRRNVEKNFVSEVLFEKLIDQAGLMETDQAEEKIPALAWIQSRTAFLVYSLQAVRARWKAMFTSRGKEAALHRKIFLRDLGGLLCNFHVLIFLAFHWYLYKFIGVLERMRSRCLPGSVCARKVKADESGC